MISIFFLLNFKIFGAVLMQLLLFELYVKENNDYTVYNRFLFMCIVCEMQFFMSKYAILWKKQTLLKK